ncbi:MAG TPA: hypothetical protein DHV62_05455, partial [Elusimicrobia bacterium]|nr:hypothetical protein [Elusimicrobiota bacterium]
MKKDKTKEKTSPPEVVTELKPWLPNVFVYVFFVFWSYLVLSNYYRQYPVGLHTLFWYFSLPGENFTLTTFFRLLPEYLFYVLLLVFFWLSTFALGWGFLKRIKVFEELNLENFLFSSGVGLAGLIVFGFFLGSLGLLYKGIVGIVVLVFAGLGFWELFKGKKDFTLKVNKLNLLEKICFILLGIVMLFHLIGAFAPETFYDAQYYHLGMTRMWVLEKRIFFTTYIGESGFPLNLHTFYTLAIVLKDETLVNLMHFSLT